MALSARGMSTTASKLSLSINTQQSKSSRKYLGDPSSPHYVPDSPLVDRQHLSWNEEEELKRSCKAVLADVQSSDNDEEESFKYLASHIRKDDKSDKHSKQPSTQAVPVVTVVETDLSKALPQQSQVSQVDCLALTSPPPVQSRRTTTDLTEYSTPLTSAGITPGEVKHAAPNTQSGFFDLNHDCESSTRSQACGVDPKSDERAAAWMTSFLEHNDQETHEHDIGPKRKKSQKESLRSSRRKTRRSQSSISLLDMNKRLPAVPGEKAGVERPMHITRLMKTIKRKGSQAVRSSGLPDPGSQPPPAQHPVEKVQPVLTMSKETHELGSTTCSQPLAPPAANIVVRERNISQDVIHSKRWLFGRQFIGRLDWRRRKTPVLRVA